MRLVQGREESLGAYGQCKNNSVQFNDMVTLEIAVLLGLYILIYMLLS